MNDRKKILVVEDDTDCRDLIGLILGSGYEIVTAVDGRSAFEMAVRERPDVILLDMMIPFIDGWEVAAQLMRDERTCHTPIIAVTARASEDSRLRAMQGGCVEYVVKPFIPEELRRIVAQVLARHASK